MQISRRNFLQATTTAASFVIAGGGLRAFGQSRSDGFFPLPAEVYSEAFFSLTSTQAEALIGTIFTAAPADGRALAGARRSVKLTLVEVNKLERKANTILGCYGESFSLIFVCQPRTTLDQGVYRMSGAGLVLDSALLVPTEINRDKYEIIVNHVTR